MWSERHMVPIRLFHGPLRDPINLDSGSAQAPFFGIAPRSLVGRVAGLEAETDLTWPMVAPLIDAALCARSLNTGLTQWLHLCNESQVLSWRASAVACDSTAAALATDIDQRMACGLPDPDEWTSIDCWQVKEGHTSSVWQVAIAFRGGSKREICCVNVARDASAAAELRATSARLQALRSEDPDHVARIGVVRTIAVGGPQQLDATVTIGEWIPGNELHVTGVGPSGRVIEVGWFLGGALPVERRQRILGRYIDGEELTDICEQ